MQIWVSQSACLKSTHSKSRPWDPFDINLSAYTLKTERVLQFKASSQDDDKWHEIQPQFPRNNTVEVFTISIFPWAKLRFVMLEKSDFGRIGKG